MSSHLLPDSNPLKIHLDIIRFSTKQQNLVDIQHKPCSCYLRLMYLHGMPEHVLAQEVDERSSLQRNLKDMKFSPINVLFHSIFPTIYDDASPHQHAQSCEAFVLSPSAELCIPSSILRISSSVSEAHQRSSYLV